MMKKTILLLSSIGILHSCTLKEKPLIKSEKGSIEMVVNTYFNPIDDFENSSHTIVGRINYNNDDLIEYIPADYESTFQDTYYHIEDSIFTSIQSVDFPFNNKKEYYKIEQKPKGISFNQIKFDNYQDRVNLPDTIIKNRKYKNFYLISKDKEYYTSFQIIETDTLYPYSIQEEIERDYKGKVTKIESFNTKHKVYTTIYLNYKKTLDSLPNEIFEYNNFLKKQ